MRRSSASPELRPQFLLEGTVYALEQGGLLLHDSVLLYRDEHYASAAALALFAIEEIGRSRLLHHLWKEAVEKGSVFTAQTLRLRCDNHVFKQTLGLGMPVLYVTESDEKLNQLFQATLVEHVTPESLKASAELQAMASVCSGEYLINDMTGAKNLYMSNPMNQGLAGADQKTRTRKLPLIACSEPMTPICRRSGDSTVRAPSKKKIQHTTQH